MPSTTASAVFAVLAAALAGGGAGFFASHRGAPPPAPSGAGPWGELLVEVRGLRADLQADLRADPRAGRTTTQPASADLPRREVVADPAAPGAGFGEQVATALDDLAARIDRLASRQALQDSVLRTAALRQPPDPAALTAAHRQVAADWTAAQQQFHFLTMAEVLRRYGPPTEIRAEGGLLTWCYDFVTTGGDAAWLGLTFADGVVVRVQ